MTTLRRIAPGLALLSIAPLIAEFMLGGATFCRWRRERISISRKPGKVRGGAITSRSETIRSNSNASAR